MVEVGLEPLTSRVSVGCFSTEQPGPPIDLMTSNFVKKNCIYSKVVLDHLMYSVNIQI